MMKNSGQAKMTGGDATMTDSTTDTGTDRNKEMNTAVSVVEGQKQLPKVPTQTTTRTMAAAPFVRQCHDHDSTLLRPHCWDRRCTCAWKSAPCSTFSFCTCHSSSHRNWSFCIKMPAAGSMSRVT